MLDGLTHEQQMLQESTRRFVDEEMLPHEDLVDREGHVSIELGRQIESRAKDVGLFAANLPENVGGGGLDYTSMAVIEREFGRTSHALHAWVARPTELLLATEGSQIEQYLIPCVTGAKRELFALSEPDDWILNGSKHFISGPVMPDFAIVFAATGHDQTPRGSRPRITAFLVDVGMSGFNIQVGYNCVSYRGYLNFKLDFDNVRLTAGHILGEEGRGLELSGKWLGMGRIWVGATCCGKAERLFEMATSWAAGRKQFGQAIGKFQATGFKLADMAVELRAADLLVKDAISKADQGVMTDSDAAMVKLYCSEMLNRVADNTVQIYGGMGLMDDLPVQRLWRDSRLERIWDGTSEIQRHIITRHLLRPLGA